MAALGTASVAWSDTPRWETWATGLRSSVRLGIGPDGSVWYSSPGATSANGPRIGRADALTPRRFSAVTQAGFAVQPNQYGVSSFAFNLANEPVVALQSNGPADGIFWRLDAPSSTWQRSIYADGRGSWDSCRQLVLGPDGRLWFGAVHADAGTSADGGRSFTYLRQTVPPGAPSPPSKVYACAIGPPQADAPTGAFFTFTEQTGVIYTLDGGGSWLVPDPANDPNDPSHRMGYGFQNASAGLVLDDGRVLGACGNATGAGGTDDVHVYAWDRARPDLPVVVANGIAPGWLNNSNNVVDGQSVQARSGAVVMSTAAYPRDGQGGVYLSLDGAGWSASHEGIRFPFVSNTPQLQRFFRDLTNSVGSLAVLGDDVLYGVTSGEIYHWLAPGELSVSGTVRDARGAPIPGVAMSTDLGSTAVTDTSGQYRLDAIGRSAWPVRIRARKEGLAFGWPDAIVEGRVTGLDITGVPAALGGIRVQRSREDFTALVGVGGRKQFEALLLDQFGHPLDVASPPAIAWSVAGPGGGSVDATGVFTGAAPGTVDVIATAGSFSDSDVAVVNASVPAVLGVDPDTASSTGGTLLTISGAGFAPTGSVEVSIGGLLVPATVLDAGTLTCVVPPHFTSGAVPVSVINTIAGSNYAGTLWGALTLVDPPGRTRFLAIVGGAEQGTGQRVVQAAPGAVVTITADAPPPGQRFYQWTGTTAALADDAAATTTLAMPDRDATVVATFARLPLSGVTEAPVITPGTGPHATEQLVTISSGTPGASIRYTLDGTDPQGQAQRANPRGFRYAGPFRVGATVVIKAIASSADRDDSAISTATLDFLAPLPAIRSGPFDRAACLGASAAFEVIASGVAPLAYQWRKEGADLSDGPRVAGATSSRLVIRDVAASDAGAYDVRVVDANGEALSPAAILAVDDTRVMPEDVSDLRVTWSGAAILTWSAPSSSTAPAFDVLRAASPASLRDPTTTACMVTASPGMSATDAVPGTAFYLVRTRDSCAPHDGQLGTDSFGRPRVARLCQ